MCNLIRAFGIQDFYIGMRCLLFIYFPLLLFFLLFFLQLLFLSCPFKSCVFCLTLEQKGRVIDNDGVKKWSKNHYTEGHWVGQILNLVYLNLYFYIYYN